MIRVHVKISGILIKPRGKDRLDLELKPDTTIKKLFHSLGYDKKHVNRIMTVVNGALRKPDYILNDGDNISLSIIIGGG
jgi:sulfur carrier protein ThiS